MLKIERARDERGLTLVELLVVMVITGIVGAVVATALVGGLRSSTRAQSRIQALTDLQRGVERVARELRVADPLCVPINDPLDPSDDFDHETQLQASVYRDGDRFVHSYYTAGSGDSQELLQDITRYSPADSATGTLVSSGVFIAEIGNDLLGEPLFEYLDRSGNDLNSTFNATATVNINLAKQVLDADPVLVTTSVEIRNTRYTGSVVDC